ncbi:DUF1648 domain-containing protein [Peribacillus glennii]|uniref:DUF1648 domain-containing protein n=1 Tax=Peribacillus glennii TaxID=2303991 RepID=A0A372LDZ6_9BACI|nr:DUF1648 domain-containing protein [Peribacillus glennii]RFU63928.1 DUF1648 domain-containing protein [Peribacillus glennii]
MERQNRPILKIEKTRLESVLNMVSLLVFCGMLMYLFLKWASLPNLIPIHFDSAGNPDGWGNKGVIWLLPLLGAVLWISLTILETFPHLYNYMRLTKENVKVQYKNSRLLVNVLKNEILLIVAYLIWDSVQLASGNEAGLGVWDVTVFSIIVFGSIGFFLIRSYRLS